MLCHCSVLCFYIPYSFFSNSSVKTSQLVEEQYGTESLESPQSSEGVKNTSTTQSITEIKDDCTPRNNSNIISLNSSPNISLPKRFNDLKLKMNISPVYQGQQKRRYSSGSDESVIYSQTGNFFILTGMEANKYFLFIHSFDEFLKSQFYICFLYHVSVRNNL